jgi:hypothetical protein
MMKIVVGPVLEERNVESSNSVGAFFYAIPSSHVLVTDDAEPFGCISVVEADVPLIPL